MEAKQFKKLSPSDIALFIVNLNFNKEQFMLIYVLLEVIGIEKEEKEKAKQEKAKEIKRDLEKTFPNFEFGMNVFTDKRWTDFWKKHLKE